MHIICKFDQANRLGKLYGRQAKPFAVMFRDLSAVKKYAELKEGEEKLVTSAHRPIVLLDKNPSLDDLDDISPGLGNTGIYLPYSGFHYVLFHYLNSDGIIMTSASVPGEPMVIRNEDAFLLKADYFLLHNRKIVNRIDNSVVRCYGGNFFLEEIQMQEKMSHSASQRIIIFIRVNTSGIHFIIQHWNSWHRARSK